MLVVCYYDLKFAEFVVIFFFILYFMFSPAQRNCAMTQPEFGIVIVAAAAAVDFGH